MDDADLVQPRGRVSDASISALPLEGRAPSRVLRWARDPFAHFLAIGVLLLVLYHLVAPDRPQALGTRIEITRDDLQQIQVAWMAKWLRPPTPAEMQDLLAEKIHGEVLYREALAMGLDQDDTIVKRRLAQKLEFLTEDVSTIRDPTRAELAAWFPANAAQFAMPGHYSFRHVYFSPDKRGAHAEADARAALASLSRAPAQDVSGIGDPFSDRAYYADRTPEELGATFGTKFAKALADVKPGAWAGPIESGLGWHLVSVEAATPTHIPTFDEADPDEVKTAWIDAQREAGKRKAYAAMRAKYDVVMPDTTQ
jgi:hypothetical protein